MKTKRTLLVVLLTLVCLVCGAIGLAACGDKEVVIKVGDNELTNVTYDGKEYKVEGEEGKTYTFTAKVDGEVSDEVYLWAGPGAYGYGTIEFEYVKDATIKVAAHARDDKNATTGEIFKKVVVTMAEKVTPPPAAGEAANPIALAPNTAVNYSAGFDYVFYKLTGLTDTRFYVFTVTGDDADFLDIAVSASLNADGDDIGEEVTPSQGKYALEKDTAYYVRVASNKTDSATGNYVTITGTLKVELYAEPEPDPVLTPEDDVVIESLTDSVTVEIQVDDDDENKYTITAYEGNSDTASAKVVLTVDGGVNYSNPITGYRYSRRAMVLTVTLASGVTDPVADVKIVMTVEEDEDDNYTQIVLGQSYTGDMTIYKLVVSNAHAYKFTASTSLWDVMVGNLTESWGSVDIEATVWFTTDANGDYAQSETVNLAAGTYYIMGYDGTFTVDLAD